jgi:N-acetylneuraminic acid mutarotase
MGTGYDDNYQKDIWEYTPGDGEMGGTWTRGSFSGSKRRDASVFIIDNKAYIVGGIKDGDEVTDFWRFDPSQEKPWFELREIYDNDEDESFDDDYDNIARYDAVAFADDNYGYLAVGTGGSNAKTTWEYEPGRDLWTEKTSFEESGRYGAVGFYVNSRFFVAAGRNGGNPLGDMQEFKPWETYDKND